MPARRAAGRAGGTAFAKVNLGLRVLRRRPDGYHDIRTVFQSIDFRDTVEVSFAPGRQRTVELQCDREDLNHEGNLAWRAADLLLRRMRRGGRVRIRLGKRIPAGGGLGGGSSDAAAVLRALTAVMDGPPGPDTQLSVASEIGSDVPYFLVGGTVAATGRGTHLKPVPEPGTVPVVLALPDIEVPTSWAYGALADSRGGRLPAASGSRMLEDVSLGHRALDSKAIESCSEWMRNDFESVVFRQFPALGEIKRQILAFGARHALLSGSGSAVFGIFDLPDSAAKVADRLSAAGVRALSTRFLSRAGCERAIQARGNPLGSSSEN